MIIASIAPAQSHLAARSALAGAREQLALVPRNEPSDVDGPLGLAGAHLLEAVELLGRAGAPASAALADARAAHDLLATWDGMGWGEGHAASAAAVLAAADRLVASAETRLDALASPAGA